MQEEVDNAEWSQPVGGAHVVKDWRKWCTMCFQTGGKWQYVKHHATTTVLELRQLHPYCTRVISTGIDSPQLTDYNFHQASHLSPPSALSLWQRYPWSHQDASSRISNRSRCLCVVLNTSKDIMNPITGIAGEHLESSLAEIASMCLAGYVLVAVRPRPKF